MVGLIKRELILWTITMKTTLAKTLRMLSSEGALGGDLRGLFFLNLLFLQLLWEQLLPYWRQMTITRFMIGLQTMVLTT